MNSAALSVDGYSVGEVRGSEITRITESNLSYEEAQASVWNFGRAGITTAILAPGFKACKNLEDRGKN